MSEFFNNKSVSLNSANSHLKVLDEDQGVFNMKKTISSKPLFVQIGYQNNLKGSHSGKSEQGSRALSEDYREKSGTDED